MESASREANPAMASVQQDISIALIILIITTTTTTMMTTVSAAARSITTNAMDSAPQSLGHVGESVLKDGLIAMVSVAVNNTIMSAMEHAPVSGGNPATDSVMRDILTAMDAATRKPTLTIIIMTAMEHVPQNLCLAMGNVWRDMLTAMDIVSLKKIMTEIIMTAMEHVP